MPKNRRAKVVSLTQTKKQIGRRVKEEQVEEIRAMADQFKHIFVFTTQNMRNSKLKELRETLKPNSRIYFGKASLSRIALGKDKTDAYKDNTEKISEQLKGSCGLLFSNEDPEILKEIIEQYQE